MKDCKNSLACLIKREIIRLTIVSTAAGVILVNQSLSLNPSGAGSVFAFNGQGLGGSDEITEQGLAETINYYIGLASKKEYVGFETAIISPDPEAMAQDGLTDDEALVVISDNAIFGSSGFSSEADDGASRKAAERKEIITYEIKAGDTPSFIAEYFGISTNTLLWANNLTLADATRIKIGDKLVILPVNGVKHTVKKGETVSTIAKKYSADVDKILAFNGISEEDALTIDAVLIVPEGKMPAPPQPQRSNASSTYIAKSSSSGGSGVYRYVTNEQFNNPNGEAGDIHAPAHGRRFPWGQCTYYAALRRYVPWNGHAKYWLQNARAYGYKTGSTPVVGSIVVTTENPRYGHVAYVEEVGDGKITISEMNYIGLGIKSVRVLPFNSPVIRGYIYDAN